MKIRVEVVRIVTEVAEIEVGNAEEIKSLVESLTRDDFQQADESMSLTVWDATDTPKDITGDIQPVCQIL